MNPNSPPPPTHPTHASSSSSGWLKGCGITCGVLFVLGVVAVALTFYFIRTGIQGKVDEYTSMGPVEIEAPVAELDEIHAAIAKFDQFRDDVLNGRTTETLELTSDEVNLLIFHHPDLKDVPGDVKMELLEDRIAAHVSIPLDELAEVLPVGGGFLEDRWLNGRILFSGGYSNGNWDLEVDAVEVKETEIPKEFLDEFVTEFKTSITAQSGTNPEFDKEMQKLQGILKEIKIENGKLIVVPMKPAAE
ncbi:MAG: hypothetical protein HKN23_02625 [Verrucomicrobiales bacterium]|nr:hypothetical protein [Verrucomicrobiales bacterium]